MDPKEQPVSCCSPSRPELGAEVFEGHMTAAELSSSEKLHTDVQIPQGHFKMGDAFDEGYRADGETPVHDVSVDEFRLDATAVTNAMFAAFVNDTGYRTEAQFYGSSAVFHLLATATQAEIVGPIAGSPWWLNIRGVSWMNPTGSGSSWKEIPDHPVVHVSHHDALAYCHWSKRRLPSEAEWEYAARGGLDQMRYSWGNELEPRGKHMCNIWQGTFPTNNSVEDGYHGTAPVRSFAPNDYGLYEMAGNIWEWCADWFSPEYYLASPQNNPRGPTTGSGRVMRGGSYLCHDSYCNRYRVSARTSNTPDSSSGNCGFRTVGMPPSH